MDDDRFLAVRAQLIAGAPAPATLRTYQRWWADYSAFARACGSSALDPHAPSLARFVAEAFAAGRGRSLDVWRASVLWAWRGHGISAAALPPEVEEMLKGAAPGGAGRPRRVPPGASARGRCSHPGVRRGPRVRPLPPVRLMLRRGELALLTVADVRESATGIQVRVHRPKTQALRPPVWHSIRADPQSPVCPVALWRLWRAQLLERGFQAGALFRAASGAPLSGADINALCSAGLVRRGDIQGTVTLDGRRREDLKTT
jgi:hypothetical protein